MKPLMDGDRPRVMVCDRRQGIIVAQNARDEIAGRWHGHHILKRDVFSTVERGRFETPSGPVEAVFRHLDDVPWWSVPVAHLLLGRERRALERLGTVPFA